MNTLSLWKKSLYSAIIFFGTIMVLSIGYGAYSAMTPVNSWQPLTMGIWNTMITNIDDLNTRVNSLASGWGNLWNTGALNSINYTAGIVGIGSTVGTNAELQIKSGTKPHWGIYQDEITEELRFWNGSNRVVFGSGGNVGIGTASPQWKFEVQNPGSSLDIGITASWANSYSRIWYKTDYAGAWNIGARNDWGQAGGFSFESNGINGLSAWTSKMFITPAGKVGIGTADPGAKLEVNGSTIYRNVNANLIARGSAASSSLVFDTSGSVGASALESTNGNLNFLSRSAAGNFGSPDIRMSILNTGNVGIGTVSPTAKLDIRGQDQVENHYMAGLINDNSGDRKIIMRHTITNTNSYYKLSLPQTYSNFEHNGGIITLKIVWLGGHAIASCSQEYKLVYGTYHTAAPSYLNISQASRMFSQCSPYSYSYTYDQTPDVDFWVDGAGGFLVFNIKWMHVQSTYRLIDIEILGQTLSTPVLSYYGTSLPAGTSALAETILH